MLPAYTDNYNWRRSPIVNFILYIEKLAVGDGYRTTLDLVDRLLYFRNKKKDFTGVHKNMHVPYYYYFPRRKVIRRGLGFIPGVLESTPKLS